MLDLINSSYEENGLMMWFYDRDNQVIIKKSKREIEKLLGVNEHKPYLLTLDERIPEGFQIEHVEKVIKYNAIKDEYQFLNKVVVRHPTVIYDRSTGTGLRTKLKTSWEDKISYNYCVAYDLGLIYGFEFPNKIKEFKFERNNQEGLLSFYRYLLDLSAPLTKRVACDIEVLLPKDYNKHPNPDRDNFPIIACSFVSRDMKKVLILKSSHLKQMSINDKEIEFCRTEKELITRIFEIWKEYPFVLTYNGDLFDLRYIDHRAKQYGLESPIIVTRTRYSVRCDLKNAIHIDLYRVLSNKLLKQAFKELKEAYDMTLDEVSRVLLNKQKLEMPDFHNCTATELKEYCLRDSEITFEISALENDKLMNLIFLVARLTNMPLTDAYRYQLVSMITSHLNWIHRLFNYLIPNSDDLARKRLLPIKKSDKRDTYAGAITIDPVSGIHFNVFVVDVASLYPTVIDIFNIDPATISCPHEECKDNLVPEHSFHICKRNKGLFSLTIGCLKTIRVQVYKPKKDPWSACVTAVLKLFCNSSYGIWGSKKIPEIYFVQIASATTAYARYCMRYLIKLIQHYNGKVLYGDSDSAFVQGTNEIVDTVIKQIKKELNVKLEMEKIFKVCVLWKKKNYLGVIDKNRQLVVKGLVGNKRDICKFIKKVFFEVAEEYKHVEQLEDLEKIRPRIRKKIKEAVMLLKLKRFELKDLVFKRRLKSDTGSGQDYDVANYYREHGVHKGAGDYIHKILTRGRKTAKPFEFIKSKDEVNIEQYISHLFSALEQVILPLGMTRENINFTGKRIDEYSTNEEIKIEFEKRDEKQYEIPIEFI